MTYFNTSTQTANERRDEADRLIQMLEGFEDAMTDKEKTFLSQMHGSVPVSPKQLFWLRDIKEKYL